MDIIEQARQLLDSMPVACAIYKVIEGGQQGEASAEYVYVNPKYKERVNKSDVEFEGRDFAEFWGEERQPDWVQEAYKSVKKGEIIYTYAYSSATKTCLDTTFTPLGKENYFLCTVKDLASKPRECSAVIESITRECTNLYKIDWESDVMTAFPISDEKNRIMSKHWESYDSFGSAVRTYVEQNVCRRDSKAVLNELLNIREILSKRDYHNITYERIMSDKTQYEQMCLSVMKDGDKNIGFTLAVKDVTEAYLDNLNRQKELQESSRKEQQLANALSSTAISFCEFNITKNSIIKNPVVRVNDEIVDLLYENKLPDNCTFSDFISKFGEGVREEDLELYDKFFSIEHFKKCYEKGALEQSIQYGCNSSVLAGHFVRQTVLLSKDENSGDILAFTYVTDITEEVRMRRELQKSLIATQQVNIDKQEIIDKFLNDIKFYMNLIMGYAAVAYDNIDDKTSVNDYLQKILGESKTLLEILDQEIEVRGENKENTVNIVETKESISDILAELRKMVGSLIESKNIDFYIDHFDVKDDVVYCDKIRFNQAMLILLSNVVRFAQKDGTVVLKAGQKKCEKEGCKRKGCAEYEFSIVGAEKILFEMMGIHFSNAKKNIEMLGGEVIVNSKENGNPVINIKICFRNQN